MVITPLTLINLKFLLLYELVSVNMSLRFK